MRIPITTAATVTALLGLTLGGASPISAQGPPPSSQGTPAQSGRGGAAGRRGSGGFVPGQQRPPGDPAQIARGKTLYGISCTGCHGADLRGGDMGGPNLLRSQTGAQRSGWRTDRSRHSRQPAVRRHARNPDESRRRQGRRHLRPQRSRNHRTAGHAAIGRAGAAQRAGRKRRRPDRPTSPRSALRCHSATGDLQGIATRIPDPKALQNSWVSGGGGGRRGGGGGQPTSAARTVTAAITLPSGEKVEGRLVRIDDFLVTVALADGTIRTFRRTGEIPQVEVHDPMKPHRDLLAVYTDKDMHDVTAYLVTLK